MTRAHGEPWIDWFAGRVALRLIKWAGKRARARGDIHEAAHCNAAILAGNSHHMSPYPLCTLPFVDEAMNEYRNASSEAR